MSSRAAVFPGSRQTVSQRAPNAPRRLQRQTARQRRSYLRNEALDGMHQRIHACGRSDMHRQAIRERRVHDGDVRQYARIQDADFIAGSGVGENGDKRRLRTRARRGRNEHRGQSAPARLADADKFVRRLVMPGTQRRHLRRVHHAAAAQRDHRIRPAGSNAGRDRIRDLDRWLRRDLGKRLCLQWQHHLLQQARTRDSRIADYEDPAPTVGLTERGEGLAGAASGDDSAREMVFEGGQGGIHRWVASVLNLTLHLKRFPTRYPVGD